MKLRHQRTAGLQTHKRRQSYSDGTETDREEERGEQLCPRPTLGSNSAAAAVLSPVRSFDQVSPLYSPVQDTSAELAQPSAEVRRAGTCCRRRFMVSRVHVEEQKMLSLIRACLVFV